MSKAKAVEQSERTFTGTRKGVAFEVRTKLTDEQAVETLRKMNPEGVGFIEDCAFEIQKMRNKLRYRDNLVAWGFRMAEEKINGRTGEGTVTFDGAKLAKVIRARKPLRFEREGRNYLIAYCGEGSKNHGSFRITNGEAFGSPNNRFFGMINPKGEWKLARAVTDEIKHDVTEVLTALLS